MKLSNKNPQMQTVAPMSRPTDQHWTLTSLDEGAVVHWHHSFGRFIRCQVVVAEHDGPDDIRPGQRCLQMVALVGKWFDGPERRIYRERLGDVFSPDPLTIYENPGSSVHEEGHADPRDADPTDAFTRPATPTARLQN